MLFISTQALRTISSTSDSSGSSDIPILPFFVNPAEPLFGSGLGDDRVYLYSTGDNYPITAQFPFRTISTLSATEVNQRDTPLMYSMFDTPALYSVKRTVSKMAREHEELYLSDNYSTACDDDCMDSPVFQYAVDPSTSNVVITTTPVEESLREIKKARRIPSLSKRTATVDVPSEFSVPGDLPKLHLGETGRSKLKSMISNMIKDDEELRAQVLAISKVKLASIGQLLQMAFVCGLWEDAVRIGEQFASSTRQ